MGGPLLWGPYYTKKSVALSNHKKMLSHYTFLVVVKLATIQVMERYRDNNICLTSSIRALFFLLGVFTAMGHVLDN